MIISTKVDPQPGQRFVEGDFDVNVGETIELVIDGSAHVDQVKVISTCKVISASVADDGLHAWLTIDVPNLASDSVDIGPMILSAEEGPGYTGYAEESI